MTFLLTGDPRRPILQRKLIESKYQIEMDLKQTHASKSRHWKVENMKSAVDDWANNSAQQLENRLDRFVFTSFCGIRRTNRKRKLSKNLYQTYIFT